jgi:small-conductance mechanosensitive channel
MDARRGRFRCFWKWYGRSGRAIRRQPARRWKVSRDMSGPQGSTRVRFDRSHFVSFGDSALNFETVYFVLTPDYNVFADINQAVNLAIYRRFAAEQIQFAYPTRTVVVKSDGVQQNGAPLLPR